MKCWLVAVALALAACGGADGGAESYQTLDDLVQAMKDGGVECTGLDADSQGNLIREGGSCEVGSEQVAVYTFGSDESLDNWFKVANAFGGIHVVGDRWVVSPEKQDTAEDIQEAIGGEVR